MKRTLIAAAAATLVAGASHAATISDTASIGLTSTDWATTVSLQQFNAALGALNSVTITVVGNVLGDAFFDNGENAVRTVTANLSAEITADGPNTSFTIVVNPLGSQAVTLGADEGEAFPDFAGSDSASITGVSGSDTDTATILSGFGDYIGLGTFDVDFDAVATSMAVGGGNVASFFTTEASASVTVVYDYTAPAPVPLPAGLPLALIGIAAFGAVKLRKS